VNYFISMALSFLLLFNPLELLIGQQDPALDDLIELAGYSYLGEADEAGDLLDGSNCYVLHFNKEELPPVNGCWSVSIYSDKTYLAVSNSLQRFSIGSLTDGLEYNPDGSLDIYIQHKRPDLGDANWLPAPRRGFFVILRLYRPKPEVLNGQYLLPYVKKIN
jgi:hypothetical protein